MTQKGYGPWFNSSINVSDSAKDLIAKLLNSDVTARPTAQEALVHPWLAGKDVGHGALGESVLSAMKQFVTSNRFKQAVCKLMANDMSPEMIKAFQV